MLREGITFISKLKKSKIALESEFWDEINKRAKENGCTNSQIVQKVVAESIQP